MLRRSWFSRSSLRQALRGCDGERRPFDHVRRRLSGDEDVGEHPDRKDRAGGDAVGQVASNVEYEAALSWNKAEIKGQRTMRHAGF